MTKKELIQELVDTDEYTEKQLSKYTPEDLLDAWLNYHGIIGYTGAILEVRDAAFEEPEEEDPPG